MLRYSRNGNSDIDISKQKRQLLCVWVALFKIRIWDGVRRDQNILQLKSPIQQQIHLQRRCGCRVVLALVT